MSQRFKSSPKWKPSATTKAWVPKGPRTFGESTKEVTLESPSSLWGAVLQQDLKAIEEHLSKEGVDVNQPLESSKHTCLYLAASNGLVESLTLLLNRGAKHPVDAGDRAEAAPLLIAIDKGHVECVRVLMEHGVDVNTAFFLKPLMPECLPVRLAMKEPGSSVLKLLLDSGKLTKEGVVQYDEDGELKWSAVWSESGGNGSPETLQAFLKVCPEAVGLAVRRMTPLGQAIMQRNEEAALELIAAGASVTQESAVLSNQTLHRPVDLVAMRRLGALMQVLVDQGVDPNTELSKGSSLLEWALEHGTQELHEKLLAGGAVADRTTLTKGVKQMEPPLLYALIAAAGDMEKDGTHALQAAAQDGKWEAVQRLLECGADAHGTRALVDVCTAMPFNAEQLVELLLPCQQEHVDEAAAAASKHKENGAAVVSVLMEAGCTVDRVPDAMVHVFAEKGMWKEVEVLVDAGAVATMATVVLASKANALELARRMMNEGDIEEEQFFSNVRKLMESHRRDKIDCAIALVKLRQHMSTDVAQRLLHLAVSKIGYERVYRHELDGDPEYEAYLDDIDYEDEYYGSSYRDEDFMGYESWSEDEFSFDDLAAAMVDVVLENTNADVSCKDEKQHTALENALDTDRREVVDVLVKHGAQVGGKRAKKLWKMAFANDGLLDMMMKQHQPPPNQVHDTPLLLIAIDKYRRDTTELYAPVARLLEAGVDVNHPEKDGYTALHAACSVGEPALVRLLLDSGADVNALGPVSPLYLAVGTYELMKILLEAGADPNLAAPDSHNTPMHMAAQNLDVESMGLLLEAGAWVDPVAEVQSSQRGAKANRLTPLALSMTNGKNEPVAKRLIDAGADVNRTIQRFGVSMSILHLAINEHHAPPMIQLLIDSGAVPDVSVCYKAVVEGARIGVLVTLMAYVDVNEPAHAAFDGQTLLMAALTRNPAVDVPTIKYLLACGANVNAVAAGGETALLCAVHGGDPRIVQLLLEAGADSSVGDNVLAACTSQRVAYILLMSGMEASSASDGKGKGKVGAKQESECVRGMRAILKNPTQRREWLSANGVYRGVRLGDWSRSVHKDLGWKYEDQIIETMLLINTEERHVMFEAGGMHAYEPTHLWTTMPDEVLWRICNQLTLTRGDQRLYIWQDSDYVQLLDDIERRVDNFTRNRVGREKALTIMRTGSTGARSSYSYGYGAYSIHDDTHHLYCESPVQPNTSFAWAVENFRMSSLPWLKQYGMRDINERVEGDNSRMRAMDVVVAANADKSPDVMTMLLLLGSKGASRAMDRGKVRNHKFLEAWFGHQLRQWRVKQRVVLENDNQDHGRNNNRRNRRKNYGSNVRVHSEAVVALADRWEPRVHGLAEDRTDEQLETLLVVMKDLGVEVDARLLERMAVRVCAYSVDEHRERQWQSTTSLLMVRWVHEMRKKLEKGPGALEQVERDALATFKKTMLR